MISGEDPQRTPLMVDKRIQKPVPKEIEIKYPQEFKVAKKYTKPSSISRPTIEDVKTLLEK